MKIPSVARVLICCLVLAACGSGGGGSNDAGDGGPTPGSSAATYSYQPPSLLDDAWAVARLEDEAIDVAPIEAMMNAIRSGTFTRIDSVVLVRNGHLVLDELIRTALTSQDREAGNTDLRLHRIFSVTKSVTSTLVGIALDRGVISSLDERVYEFFPQYSPFANWDPAKADATIYDFLTMQHGLDWDESTYPYTDQRNSLIHALNNCSDYVRCFLNLPLVQEPGTRFNYATHASLTLGAIVEDQSGMGLESFADQELLTPLGIDYYRWAGESPNGRALAGSGLLLTSRDMAKLGQLFLDGGVWDGVQVVSSSWISEATDAKVAFGGNTRSAGYGYQWWVNRFSHGAGSVDGFHAAGYGGQYIFVVPALHLVAVFTGSNYGARDDAGQAADLLEDYILPATH